MKEIEILSVIVELESTDLTAPYFEQCFGQWNKVSVWAMRQYVV